MRMMFGVLIAAILFAGCSQETREQRSVPEGAAPGTIPQASQNEDSEAALPDISYAEIVPLNAVDGQPLTVQYTGSAAEGQMVTYTIRWYVDRVLVVEGTENILDPQYFRKGESVEAEVIPRDGQREGRAYRTKTVTIGNTPPSVADIELSPVPAFSEDRITAVPRGEDADGDRILFEYKWAVDNSIVPGAESQELVTTGMKKKSKVSVTVTPFDGEARGNPLQSRYLVLSNRAPEITSEPPSGVTAKYEYQVAARDVDGDTLAYSLVTAPQGMVIHPSSGLITWALKPVTSREEVGVKITVRDGDGGVAYQEYTLILEPK